MNNFNSLFVFNTCKLKPKDSLFVLKHFHKKYKFSSFDLVKKSQENLSYLKQKNYILQIYNRFSTETFLFNIYKDEKAFYLLHNSGIKKFHTVENALKYKLSKECLNLDNHSKTYEYYCFDYSYNNECCENEYINNGFVNGKRIYI
jgi:hypothetical protein